MKSFAALLVLISLAIPAYASGTDEDLAEIKAHEQAVKEADANYKAQEEKNKRETAAFKVKQDAQTANAIRPQLGKAAEGKSDEAVILMYEEKVAREDKNKPQDEAAIRKNVDSLMQKTLGKSMQDMQDMSDEDLNKMEEQLKKQYGQ
ncbi:MAG: hypothetical protein QX198_09930 [Methylococcaceae bacterium]